MINNFEDLAWAAAFVLLTLFLVGGVAFHICKSLRDGVISGRKTQLTPTGFAINRHERPFLYWSLIGFYIAILLGIVISMAVPLISGIVQQLA